MTALLARALLHWAYKLGKAILERLAKRAGVSAVAYYRRRAAYWERRRMALLPIVDAAKKGTRARFRAVRKHQAAQAMRNLCNRFAAWLAEHVDEVTPAAVRGLCEARKAVISKIPLHSPMEKCAA